MIAAVEYTVNAIVGELIGNECTTIAQDAMRHVQFDLIADVDPFECSAFFFVARFGNTVFVGEILQIAFASLVADRAIERVIDQQELDNAFACFENFGRRNVLNNHAVHDRRAARSHKLGHGTRVFLWNLVLLSLNKRGTHHLFLSALNNNT